MRYLGKLASSASDRFPQVAHTFQPVTMRSAPLDNGGLVLVHRLEGVKGDGSGSFLYSC